MNELIRIQRIYHSTLRIISSICGAIIFVHTHSVCRMTCERQNVQKICLRLRC